VVEPDLQIPLGSLTKPLLMLPKYLPPLEKPLTLSEGVKKMEVQIAPKKLTRLMSRM